MNEMKQTLEKGSLQLENDVFNMNMNFSIGNRIVPGKRQRDSNIYNFFFEKCKTAIFSRCQIWNRLQYFQSLPIRQHLPIIFTILLAIFVWTKPELEAILEEIDQLLTGVAVWLKNIVQCIFGVAVLDDMLYIFDDTNEYDKGLNTGRNSFR